MSETTDKELALEAEQNGNDYVFEAVASFAQQRLWFLDQLEPGSPVYNINLAFRLNGALDKAALQKALAQLVARHESLRTTFDSIDQETMQVIADCGSVKLQYIAANDIDGDQFYAQLKELAAEPFDLAKGPLLRAHLLDGGSNHYVLLLVIHHIISDAWSLDILYRELVSLYAAAKNSSEADLSELPIQYADFAEWQQEWLSGDELDKQLGYWRERLADAPELLELPLDHLRPRIQTHAGATLERRIDAQLAGKLKQLAQDSSCTQFILYLAAFSLLLARYGATDDVVVGTPIAGRKRKELEGLIGFFVNTLGLRVELTGDPSFNELVDRVKQSSLGAYAHQELPFEKLVEVLQPKRSTSHSPLFQVMFALQHAMGESMPFADLQTESLMLDSGTAKFDLTLFVTELNDGTSALFEYNTDLFDAITIEHMLDHFEALLYSVVDDPTRRISQLSMLTAGERKQHVDWNETARTYPDETTLISLFESQVDQTPDAPAITFAEETLCYSELNARANKLAHYLQQSGVGPESLVGICMERSTDLVIAIYGVLKAGGAYVPLDPDYPQQRLQHMLEDARVNIVLSQSTVAQKLPVQTPNVINTDAGPDAIAISNLPSDNPPLAAGPNNAAYVIFTSGSTGRSKGVLNEHRGICNQLLWIQDEYGLDADDRVLQKTPYSFDVSICEFLWPLLNGAHLIIAKPGGHKDADYLAKLIQQQQITTLQFVPSMLRSFLQNQRAGGCDSIVRVICAGEALPLDLQASFFATLDAKLHNLYGPTEAAIHVTYWNCDKETGSTVPIGRPVANTQIHIVDPAGRPVPVGLPGELLIGGVQLARGYVNRPDLTAEKFIPDLFSDDKDARLYRTGDLARYRNDGAIEFLGRIDFQVKLRGFRIELGEIETVLAEHAAVKQAAVLLREDNPGDQRLVGYVVGTEHEPDTEILKAHLKEQLPDYMVPSILVAMDALPLTPSGKLARRSLPVPNYGDAAQRYVAPRNATEETLVSIWAEVLVIDQVGIHDDFFELGGHSLLATQIISRVRDRLATEVPLMKLFEHPSVAEFAGQLLQTESTAGSAAITPHDRSTPLPLSFAQQRLWFLEKLEPGNTAYNFPVAIELTGAINEAALLDAINQLIARHEALRTRFADDGVNAAQLIDEHVHIALDKHTEAQAFAELQHTLTALSQQPFDLSSGPLLRAHLLNTDQPNTHVLLLVTHHIVSDGWSLNIMLSELADLYRACSAGVKANLADLPIQYGDFAAWQRTFLSGDSLQAQLDYWRDQLADLPPLLDLPTDRPRPAEQTYAGSSVVRWLSTDLQSALNRVATEQGCTMYMLLMAVFDVLLSTYASAEDVVVGSPIAGRQRTELEGLVGFLSNTLAIPAHLGNDPVFSDFLKSVKASMLGAYAHQDLPFEKLVEELQPKQAMSHSPIFQVMFVFQNNPESGIDFGDVQGRTVGFELGLAKFDLLLEMAESPDGLRTGLQYNTDLFNAVTIERMLDHFEALLHSVVDDPTRPISRLSMLDEAERQHVLTDFNQTRADFAPSTVNQLVEAQTERTPDAVAVTFGDHSLSYAELNGRANTLARTLQLKGAGPGKLVGICAERCVEMTVGVLAVLKSGAAYVPIDPNYPAERVAIMLQDSQAQVLLTQTAIAAQLPEHSASTILLDDFDWKEDQANLDVRSESVYVIYTSGSTGKPKGVELTHVGLSNLIQWQSLQPGLNKSARTLQFASLSFDVSFQELFTTWAQGGTLVLVSDEQRRDLAGLAKFIAAEGIERVYLPFAALQPLADAVVNDASLAFKIEDVIVAGEQLQITPAVRGMFNALGEARLHNHYGPSETHVTTAFTLSGSPDDWMALPPIGTPVANTQVYVLDANNEPVPVGLPGELYLGGAQIAKGYINRPELTAEKFLSDPYSKHASGRIYRTGDRVRFLPDGNLEYLGRTDDQVKWRGFRIEPGEIETVLMEHASVKQAAVLLREDNLGDRRLVGYVVGAEHEPDTETLKAHLKEQLPDYMVPSILVAIDALPLTPSGKLARHSLPAPNYGDAAQRYVAPRDATEEALVGIWAEVLAVDLIGVHDDFFELGGHSLLATQLISRVRDTLAIEMPLKYLFHNPTPGSLAAALQALLIANSLQDANEDNDEEREEFEL